MQSECIFLKKVYPNELKKNEYHVKRQDSLTIEFLLRIFTNNLKTEEDYEKIIDKKCLIFMEESNKFRINMQLH
ncbi:uncharacterized protein T551_03642 [Pneumocystis jirovecii RU7]|uniref:Uncharacterized protein n=1 Tax=Pneumocystis jirovecii (strain RU7) TaxID=1408657 RepID=A0A0W4ZCF8_PNEJ7|nr:uncharacterized protein T551_03642 [Pneumocystis jirovecii RU7]KTW26070.1 hypothetical protein T551_03642 [Pneumocystis jirovecii RU7]